MHLRPGVSPLTPSFLSSPSRALLLIPRIEQAFLVAAIAQAAQSIHKMFPIHATPQRVQFRLRVLKDTTNPHFDLGGGRCGLEGLSSCGCARDMRCCVCSLATLLSAGGILAKSVRALRLNEAAAQGSKPPFPGFVPHDCVGATRQPQHAHAAASRNAATRVTVV
jgi:hypothetical protein